MENAIIEEFIKTKDLYSLFHDRLRILIENLLSEKNISIHLVNGRVKSIESLSKKLEKKDNKYTNLCDITDLIGIRIITYLENDVDEIATLIENEFQKDDKNSIDKRLLRNDQFGYRSLHIVVSLRENRYGLPEYHPYRDIKCEIQIRSVLQHAWAEIEHDLGYKSENIPDQYKRTFNRISALLETADHEFVRLKNDLTNYEIEVPKMIEEKPEDVDINIASMNSFEISNPILMKARTIITSMNQHISSSLNTDSAVISLNKLGIKTIKELEANLKEYEQQYYRFVHSRIELRQSSSVFAGAIASTFFIQFLVLKRMGIGGFNVFYDEILDIKMPENMSLIIDQSFKKSITSKMKF